jgi:hypothetical protein
MLHPRPTDSRLPLYRGSPSPWRDSHPPTHCYQRYSTHDHLVHATLLVTAENLARSSLSPSRPAEDADGV